MIRLLGTVFMACSLALVVHALAQDQAGEADVLKKKPAAEAPERIPDPKKVDENEQKGPRFEPLKPITPSAPSKEESPEEILKRVQKNMEASEKRLDKKDVGDETRQIQGDILRDLDKLIDQAENSQGGGGKSKPSLGSKSGKTGSQTQAQKKPGPSKQSGTDKGEQQASDAGNKKEQPGATQDGDGKDKVASDKEPGDKKGEDGKQQGKNGNAATGGNSPEKKEKNTVADLFTEVWGHLPATKRQEMDAYSRERFMAKYEDVLREYYRTIAERSRRGGK